MVWMLVWTLVWTVERTVVTEDEALRIGRRRLAPVQANVTCSISVTGSVNHTGSTE